MNIKDFGVGGNSVSIMEQFVADMNAAKLKAIKALLLDEKSLLFIEAFGRRMKFPTIGKSVVTEGVFIARDKRYFVAFTLDNVIDIQAGEIGWGIYVDSPVVELE